LADETFPPELVEQAQAAVLANATAEGRCPHCGRRHDSDEGRLFDELRSEVAAVREERDGLRKEAENLRDSNALYAAEVERYKQQLAEAG